MLLLAMAGLLGVAVGYIIGGLVEERMWRQFCFDLLDQERAAEPKQPAERPRPAEPRAHWPAMSPAEEAEFSLGEPDDKREQRKRERQERTFWS